MSIKEINIRYIFLQRNQLDVLSHDFSRNFINLRRKLCTYCKVYFHYNPYFLVVLQLYDRLFRNMYFYDCFLNLVLAPTHFCQNVVH